MANPSEEIGPTVEPPETAIDSKVEDSPQSQASGDGKGKKKGHVRFATTEEGEVVPQRFKIERPSATPRSKANEALEWLLAGNERFRKGALERCKGGPEIIRETASDTPRPCTVIVSCSDSRVSPEVVMDQGLGDCHVVRVAGNVVNDFVMGTILFAVQHLGCRLVLVLGHTHCTVVASAVQSWARSKSRKQDVPTVRSLAEGVQKTISLGTMPPGVSTPVSQASKSPFEAEAWKVPEEKKPSLISRLCGSNGKQQEAAEEVAAASPADSQGKRSPSNERAISRGSITRSSMNPLAALINVIGGVVENVANSGQHDAGLKSLVNRETRERDRGWDSDDEDLKKGLAKQDSLEFNRARLARQREERKIETLRQLACREDVDSIIDENTKVSASSIIKGLVKNLDPTIVPDLEVVAAKYTIGDGSLKLLCRNWYANNKYFSSTE